MGAGPSVRKTRDSEESSSSSSGYFGAVDAYTNISCDATWTDVLRSCGLAKFCDILFTELEIADIDTYNRFKPSSPDVTTDNTSRQNMVSTILNFLLSIEDTNYASKLRASMVGKFHLRLGIRRHHMQKFCTVLIKTLTQTSSCMLLYDTMHAWSSLTQWAVDAMYVTPGGEDTSWNDVQQHSWFALQIESNLSNETHHHHHHHHRQSSGKSEVFSRINSATLEVRANDVDPDGTTARENTSFNENSSCLN